MDSSASGHNQCNDDHKNRGTRKRLPSVKSEQAEDLHGTKSAPNGINVPGQCTREVGQLGGSTADQDDSYVTDQAIRRASLSTLNKFNHIMPVSRRPATVLDMTSFSIAEPKMMTSEG